MNILKNIVGLVISLIWSRQLNSYLTKTLNNWEFGITHKTQISLIIISFDNDNARF